MQYKIQGKDGKSYTVQLIRAFDAKNDPFSAFIIFEKGDFKRLRSEALNNLRNYQDSIIYMKKGHDVTKEEEEEVIGFVNKYYLKIEDNKAIGGRQDDNRPSAKPEKEEPL